MAVAALVILMLCCFGSLVAVNRIFGKAGIVAIYIFYVIMSQILINVQMIVFGVLLTIGSVMFATLSVCIDIGNELYGKKYADRIVNVGIFILIMLFIITNIVKIIPIEDNEFVKAFNNLFSNQNRIILSDILFSYLVFQKVDILLFDIIKKKTKGKHLWLRGGASTAISQTFIAVFFYEASFIGVWTQSTILTVVLSGLLIKYLFSIIEIPVLYLSKALNYNLPLDSNT